MLIAATLIATNVGAKLFGQRVSGRAKEGELRNDVGGGSGGAEQFYSVSFATETLFSHP